MLSFGLMPLVYVPYGFFRCVAISEHVTSNASDSESSYRKCFKFFVYLDPLFSSSFFGLVCLSFLGIYMVSNFPVTFR